MLSVALAARDGALRAGERFSEMVALFQPASGEEQICLHLKL